MIFCARKNRAFSKVSKSEEPDPGPWQNDSVKSGNFKRPNFHRNSRPWHRDRNAWCQKEHVAVPWRWRWPRRHLDLKGDQGRQWERRTTSQKILIGSWHIQPFRYLSHAAMFCIKSITGRVWWGLIAINAGEIQSSLPEITEFHHCGSSEATSQLHNRTETECAGEGSCRSPGKTSSRYPQSWVLGDNNGARSCQQKMNPNS